MSTRSRNDVVDFALRGPLVGAQKGAVFAAAVVVAAAVLTGIWMPTDRWGALAAWAATVGTLLAVSVAVATARHEAETAAIRAREDQAEREIQQARLVTVELSYPELDDYFNAKYYDVGVTITNHSDALILDPRLEGFIHPHSGETSWEIAEVPEHADYTGPCTVLAPSAPDGLAVTVTHRPEIPPGEPAKVEPVIGFTDAAGRRWRRIGSALPVRVRVGEATGTPQRRGVIQARTFQVSGPDWYRID